MSNVIFIGPAGSGKGAHSKRLSNEFGIAAISTGFLLREKVKLGGNLGDKIENIISKGELVEDDLIFDILCKRLEEEDCKKGYILDGFPRTKHQAEQLDKYLAAKNDKIDKVIVLDVPDDVVTKRISGRFQCSRCNRVYNKFFEKTKIDGICDDCGSKDFFVRSDDVNVELVNNRLDIYKRMSSAIINYYDKKNLIYFVDSLNSIDKIYQDIKDILIN